MGHFQVHFEDVPPVVADPIPGQEGEPDVRFVLSRVAATPFCFFRCVFPPGALHGRHFHPNSDEFVYVVRGYAAAGTDLDEHDAPAGTTIYSRRGEAHWIRNISDSEDLELVGGFPGAADLDAAGYVFVGAVTDDLRTVPNRP